MNDAEETRKIPKTWGEYIGDIVEVWRVMRWVNKEFHCAACEKWVKRFLLACVLMTVFQMAQPWTVSYIFNGLIARDLQLVLLGFGGFTLCAFTQKMANWKEACSREWLLGLSMGAVDRRITERMFEKSVGQHLREGSFLHVSNIDKGRWRAYEMMFMLLFDCVPITLMLLVSYLFLWVLSPVAGGIMTAVIFIFLAWSVYLGQQTVEVCTPIESEFRRINRHRVERWEKIERVKTCGKECEELDTMDGWWDGMISKDRNFWLWYISHGTVRGCVNLIGLSAVMVYGAWLVWTGVWEAGRLYPLYAWATLLSNHLWMLSMFERKLNWSMPSVRSMMDALIIEPDVSHKDGAEVLPLDQPVQAQFRNVSYAYPEEKAEDGKAAGRKPLKVIRNVSFTVAAGEKVALIGGSGAGKTTIMRLLMRFSDPDEGEILINGHSLKEVDLVSWMRLVGYIPQQAQVLDGTIRYNLTYGLPVEEREKITDDELWQLMRLLKIDFGERLTDGLETQVGRNGMKLSGGQAQRLMIGAAVVKKPRFMVIDEATSSLDSTTEKAVQKGLAVVLSEDVSALIIAHRLSTVRYLCDRFIVLRETMSGSEDQFQIEAVASTFEELYGISPTFRELADDQDIVIDGSEKMSCNSKRMLIDSTRSVSGASIA